MKRLNFGDVTRTFFIHTETVNLAIALSQPFLDVCDSIIIALSCNDFPSQHQGEGHIVLGQVRRYSNAGFLSHEVNIWQVDAVGLAAQGIRNHVCLS
jgi:hypothetical protein